MAVVQYIGRPNIEAIEFAGLERWIELVVKLAPDFKYAYYVGGILLSLSPSAVQFADRILAQAEDRFADYDFAIWRGYVAQYGLMDPESAARHYERASRMGAPKWIAERAKSVLREASDCAAMQRSLRDMASNTHGQAVSSLVNSASHQRRTIIHCLEKTIETAGARFRILKTRDAATLSELFEEGLLERQKIFSPPGECWHYHEGKATLRPCALTGNEHDDSSRR